MGENSIINTSESRVKVWLTEEASVVRDLSRVPKRGECDRASIAVGVDHPDIDVDPAPRLTGSGYRGECAGRKVDEDDSGREFIASCERILTLEGKAAREGAEARDRAVEASPGRHSKEEQSRGERALERVAEEEEKGGENSRKNRALASRTRGLLSSAGSSCARLIQRIIVLLLSLLGAPLSPSPQQYSGPASRGPALYTGSFFALVSLLVLLHPSMAIPTLGNDSGASGGAGSSSATNLTFGERNASLPRTINRGRTNPVVIDEHHHRREEKRGEEPRDGGAAGFESGASAAKPRGPRRSLEHASRQFPNEEDEEQREFDDEEEEEEEDAFPASLIPHTRDPGQEMRSRLPEAELDTIRRSIVEGLGLERIPDPSKANVSQTEYRRAHEEYLTRLQHSRDSGDGRQRRLHTFHPAEGSPSKGLDRKPRSAGIEPEVAKRKEESRVLYFPIEIPEEDSLMEHASLRLLLDARDTSIERTSHAISLYRLKSPDSREFIARKVLFRGELAGGPRWVELDATELGNLWSEGSANRDIVVELKFECLETGRELGGREKQPLIVSPVLNIFTASYPSREDSRGSRRKRRANPEHLMSVHKGRRTECRGENKKCCRHEMTVTFKDLKGFEFIVQPKNFDAGYCKGRCPPRYNPAHHHALLQSLIWKEDRRKAPRPCCAPSKLDQLEILYFDENDPTKLKISSWKNMKVLECACS
ncbi:bone morphogenetic protein 4 [Venturia canescens]|uniref:bone morphogenetic protein 4 n=1 Tax=Venturia canescens TaxID=32260 RepID=UPI001C9D415E|nr:bone morphogenetic protein 4 [Venturia canescens]